MAQTTVRDLRKRGREIIERVIAGERLTITRSGRPVAELRPLGRRGPDGATLLARWKRVPCVDVDDFRRDLDSLLDPSFPRGRSAGQRRISE